LESAENSVEDIFAKQRQFGISANRPNLRRHPFAVKRVPAKLVSDGSNDVIFTRANPIPSFQNTLGHPAHRKLQSVAFHRHTRPMRRPPNDRKGHCNAHGMANARFCGRLVDEPFCDTSGHAKLYQVGLKVARCRDDKIASPFQCGRLSKPVTIHEIHAFTSGDRSRIEMEKKLLNEASGTR
jgi:hypothetical protein